MCINSHLFCCHILFNEMWYHILDLRSINPDSVWIYIDVKSKFYHNLHPMITKGEGTVPLIASLMCTFKGLSTSSPPSHIRPWFFHFKLPYFNWFDKLIRTKRWKEVNNFVRIHHHKVHMNVYVLNFWSQFEKSRESREFPYSLLEIRGKSKDFQIHLLGTPIWEIHRKAKDFLVPFNKTFHLRISQESWGFPGPT